MLHRRCLLILLNCSRTFTEALSKIEKSTRSTHLTSSCNINQTMVCFDMPRSNTNDVIGKDIRIKTEKKGVAIDLAASATREKLPAVIYFKESLGV